MAEMKVWTLPVIPPASNPFYLTDLVCYKTREGVKTLYYSKYIVDMFGELSLTDDLVREWHVPSSLYMEPDYGSLSGICLGHDKRIWGTLHNGDRLIALDTQKSEMVSFGTEAVSSTGYNMPFSRPRRIKFDSKGDAWYSGWYNNLLIGRFSVDDLKTNVWIIPGLFVSIWDIAVESSGKVVWCTLYSSQANYYQIHPFLGRLDVDKHMFEYWSIPSLYASDFAGARGLTFDTPQSPANVWLSLRCTTQHTSALNYRIATAKFIEYPKTVVSVDFSSIKMLDTKPCFTDRMGGLVTKLKFGKTCSQALYPVHTRITGITPVMLRVKKLTATAKPVEKNIKPERKKVDIDSSNCFDDYVLPFGYHPVEMQIVDETAYLTLQGDRIGALVL